MGAPYNNLLRRCEDAVKAYIEANDAPDAGVSIYRTLDQASISGSVKAPCYIISARKARYLLADIIPEQPGLPPCVLDLSITARTLGEDLLDADGKTVKETARDCHDRLVGRLLDLLTTGTLTAGLNAQGISGIHFSQCDLPEESISTDGDHVETEITLAITAESVEG